MPEMTQYVAIRRLKTRSIATGFFASRQQAQAYLEEQDWYWYDSQNTFIALYRPLALSLSMTEVPNANCNT